MDKILERFIGQTIVAIDPCYGADSEGFTLHFASGESLRLLPEMTIDADLNDVCYIRVD